MGALVVRFCTPPRRREESVVLGSCLNLFLQVEKPLDASNSKCMESGKRVPLAISIRQVLASHGVRPTPQGGFALMEPVFAILL
jgi:hypothetical protein